MNYDHISNYTAMVSLSPKISIWSPRLQFNLMGQNLKIPFMGTELRMNNPLLFINFYNSISVGKGFTITGDMLYHTSGDMDVVTLKPSWQINLGVAKTIGNCFSSLVQRIYSKQPVIQ